MDLVGALVTGGFGILLGPFVITAACSVPPTGRALRCRQAVPRGTQAWVIACVGSTVAGLVSAAVCIALGWTLPTLALSLAAVVGTGLVVTDVRVRRLPHLLTGAMYTVCVVAFGVQWFVDGQPTRPLRAGLAAAVVLVASLLLALALPGHLGLGDVVLMGWVALSLGWWGWRSVTVALMAALAVQAVVAVMTLLVGTARGSALPLGPALMGGWLVAVALVAR